ncbi:SH3 domain-containing protein [Acuticoccus sp. MNP-M23]
MLAKLPSGARLNMLGRRAGDWHFVEVDDGRRGWVSWRSRRWIKCVGIGD